MSASRQTHSSHTSSTPLHSTHSQSLSRTTRTLCAYLGKNSPQQESKDAASPSFPRALVLRELYVTSIAENGRWRLIVSSCQTHVHCGFLLHESKTMGMSTSKTWICPIGLAPVTRQSSSMQAFLDKVAIDEPREVPSQSMFARAKQSHRVCGENLGCPRRCNFVQTSGKRHSDCVGSQPSASASVRSTTRRHLLAASTSPPTTQPQEC